MTTLFGPEATKPQRRVSPRASSLLAATSLLLIAVFIWRRFGWFTGTLRGEIMLAVLAVALAWLAVVWVKVVRRKTPLENAANLTYIVAMAIIVFETFFLR